MACRYFYKGREFESELVLDDFLIEKLPFEPTLGDMVFSNTQEQNQIATQIDQIEKTSAQVREEAKKIRRQTKEFDENGEPLIKKPPYIGVNRFIGEYRTSTGKQIIREFRDEEYWIRRFADWKEGDYTPDEKTLFGITTEKGPKISDPEQHKKMRKEMENKWKNQAKAGDAIHNVLQLFFTRGENNEYLFTMLDEDFKQYCLDHLDADNAPYITEPVIEKTIQYARKLHNKIKSEFGENCIFYPEFTIVQKTNTINPDTLLGMIDLLIVAPNGGIHILDYKTSLHSYDEFSSDKRLGYKYQQAVYQRMLEKYGFNMIGGSIMIAPIQILGFHKDSNDKWVYDDITNESDVYYHIENMEDKIWSNIDDFMLAPFHVTVTTDQAISTVSDMMSKWFPDYSDGRLDNEQATLDWLKKKDLLKRNNKGQFEFKKYSNDGSSIIADTETDFVKKVTDYFKKEAPKRTRKAQELRVKIKAAIDKGIDQVEFPTPFNKEGNLTWLKDTISPYCNGNWIIDESAQELLDNFGIIMLRTREDKNVPPQIDFIRVSTRDLSRNYRPLTNENNPFKNRKSLVGALEPDIQALSKQNNLMMEAAIGNVELMETMLVINQMVGLKGRTIGNIQVVNPNFGNGLQASNEELFYCFQELNKHKAVPNNKFSSGEIKLATKYELVQQKVAHILASGSPKEGTNNYIAKKIQNATAELDSAIQGPNVTESKIQALQKCLDMLTGKKLGEDQRSMWQKELDKVYKDQHQLKKAHIDLYNTILMAIGDLKGVNYRQQLSDHYQWFSDIMKVHQEGFTGNYSDNPGNLKSETLNLVTKLVTEAYQNTREEIQRKNVKLRQLVQKVKDEASLGVISENTIGNQVNLYKNMYEKRDGDLVFVNPDTLYGAQKEFLEFMLDEINKDRFPQYSAAQRKAMKDTGNPDYYRVPLCVGGSDTTASTRGLLSMFRSKLEYFIPHKAWELAKKKMEGIFDKESSDRQHKSELLYKMTNMFDVGNDVERRIEKIAEMESKNIPLELNFETLLLKHMFAYSVQRNMDEVFPLIKSSMIHIQAQGAQQNTVFNNDTKYLEEYIRNKIFNETIVEKENEGWVRKANIIKQAASMFTLAMAPVQMFYQPLQGLWNDISLMIRKPDGKDSFTFKHFMAAIKLVFGDLTHFSDKPTLCSALNELYGINDMDMNTYVDRISTAKKGVWNMSNFLFKFASRPDFYNRMTIFTSQMMGDGCLEAHRIDSNGNLVYDWTKDKRFSEFAKNPKGTSEIINKQRSLYYTIAQQFVNEHVRNADGTLFELNINNPNPLPRAYTNKEAESMKSLGDNIYGYYSHEKKSLIMSTAIGSLWLQFRTYWSGKKNQYLAHGGVKLQGDWKHYEENGEKYYYQTNENGVVLYNEKPLSESEMKQKGLPLVAPVMQWKGQWQEGIILTLSDMISNMWNKKSIKAGWNSKFGEDVDPYLRKVYKCNMQQLAYDFIMFAVIGSILGALLGDWLDNLKDSTKKNRDFTVGLGVAAANVAVMSVKNSFLDFNFFSSIADPFGQWTPFSIDWGTRMFKNWWNVAMGDEDFWDGVVKSSGGLKQIKPALDAIKPDMFRTEREGGTFNKKE